MRKLAAFEGYLDRFVVNESDLIERGFLNRVPEFTAWVAEMDARLQGYALVYSIPFTFDLRPTVVLKELFVDESARGHHCGRELFQAVTGYARSINARLLRWQVLPSNEAAKKFYRQLGGESDSSWESWVLEL
jgi:GNAT superfamily N-acetyltransferase